MTANSKILIINFAVFGLSYFLLQYGIYLNNVLALYPISSDFFFLYQLVTHLFSHSTPEHLYSNMLLFLIFSPLVEDKMGKKEFWKFYILTGLFSSGLYCLFSQHSIIGASGCVFGVMAAYSLTNKSGFFNFDTVKDIIKTGLNIIILLFFGIEIYYSIFSIDDIAHIGHVLGFIFAVFYIKKDLLFSRS
jgi:membrane associated rhomboid family serine protease